MSQSPTLRLSYNQNKQKEGHNISGELHQVGNS